MIIQFLQSFGSLLESIMGIIINFFVMLLTLITTVPRAISYIFGVVAYMPPFVGSVIFISVAIAVIITIVNHWGS